MIDDARSGAAARGKMILCSTVDGQTEIQLRAEEGTVWLAQAQMAELFQTSAQAITQILGSIFRAEELSPEQLVRKAYRFEPRDLRVVTPAREGPMGWERESGPNGMRS